MKPHQALITCLAIAGLYLIACSLEFPADAFERCVDQNSHWVITDTDISSVISRCERVTGYKSDYSTF